MAISLVQTKAATGATAGSLAATWGSNTTTGDLIVVLTYSGTSTVSGITDSQGNTYVKADAFVGAAHYELWYAKNIAGGTTPTVTVTYASSSSIGFIAREYAGLDTTAPLDVFAHANGATNSPSSGVTTGTANANDLLVGWVGVVASSSTITAGTSYGNLQQFSGSNCLGLEDQIVNTTGDTQAGTFHLASIQSWAAGVVKFKGSASGSTTQTQTGQIRIGTNPKNSPSFAQPVNQPLKARVPKRQQPYEHNKGAYLVSLSTTQTQAGQIRVVIKPGTSWVQQPTNQPLRSRIPKRQQPIQHNKGSFVVTFITTQTQSGQIRVGNNPALVWDAQAPEPQQLRNRIPKRQQVNRVFVRTPVGITTRNQPGQIRIAQKPGTAYWTQPTNQPLRSRVPKRLQPIEHNKGSFLTSSATAQTIGGQIRVSVAPSALAWIKPTNQLLRNRVPRRQQPIEIGRAQYLLASSTTQNQSGRIRVSLPANLTPWKAQTNQFLRNRVPKRQQPRKAFMNYAAIASGITNHNQSGQIRIKNNPAATWFVQPVNQPLKARVLKRQQPVRQMPQVVYPLISSISDDFNGISYSNGPLLDGSTAYDDTWMWTVQAQGSSTVTPTNAKTDGRVHISPADSTVGYSGYVTANTYSLKKSRVYVQVPQVLNAGGSFDTILQVAADSSNRWRIYVSNGTLVCRYTFNGSDTNANTRAYDSSQHAWWAIRDNGFNVVFETSPNGVTWTQIASAGSSNLYGRVDRVTVSLLAGLNGSATGAGTAIFDNFNITPAWIGWKQPVNQPLKSRTPKRQQPPSTASDWSIFGTAAPSRTITGQIRISSNPATTPSWKQPVNQPLRSRVPKRQQVNRAWILPELLDSRTIAGQIRISVPQGASWYVKPTNQPLRNRVPKRQQPVQHTRANFIVSAPTVQNQSGQIRITLNPKNQPFEHLTNQPQLRRAKPRQQPVQHSKGAYMVTSYDAPVTIAGQIRIAAPANIRFIQPTNQFLKNRVPKRQQPIQKTRASYTVPVILTTTQTQTGQISIVPNPSAPNAFVVAPSDPGGSLSVSGGDTSGSFVIAPADANGSFTVGS